MLLAGLLSLATVIVTWPPWYADLLRINRFAAARSFRLTLALVPAVCITFLYLCTDKLAAREVRASGAYVAAYTLLGAAAIGIAGHLFAFFGIGARDDVLERRNHSSLIAICSALVGATLCCAGGTIGEGPGVGAVAIAIGFALGCWFLLWYCSHFLTKGEVTDRITIDRDQGCGMRFGGLLIANGAILGASAAGSWTAGPFVSNFAITAWLAFVLTAFAIFIERLMQPRSSGTQSFLLGLAYCTVAALWVIQRGVR